MLPSLSGLPLRKTATPATPATPATRLRKEFPLRTKDKWIGARPEEANEDGSHLTLAEVLVRAELVLVSAELDPQQWFNSDGIEIRQWAADTLATIDGHTTDTLTKADIKLVLSDIGEEVMQAFEIADDIQLDHAFERTQLYPSAIGVRKTIGEWILKELKMLKKALAEDKKLRLKESAPQHTKHHGDRKKYEYRSDKTLPD